MQKIHGIMLDIINNIEHDYSKSISLKDIANRHFYSYPYLSRTFKDYFGISFSKYLQKFRINKATQLLQNTTLSIEKISERTGYRDKREFYRAFKNETGTTPGNLRKTLTE